MIPTLRYVCLVGSETITNDRYLRGLYLELFLMYICEKKGIEHFVQWTQFVYFSSNHVRFGFLVFCNRQSLEVNTVNVIATKY